MEINISNIWFCFVHLLTSKTWWAVWIHSLVAKETLSVTANPVATEQQYAFGSTKTISPTFCTRRVTLTPLSRRCTGGIITMSHGSQIGLFWHRVGHKVSAILRKASLCSSEIPYLLSNYYCYKNIHSKLGCKNFTTKAWIIMVNL